MTTPARSAVVIQAGMTHGLARRVVGVVWPEVKLDLYYPSTGFYKEGFPYPAESWTNDEDVLKAQAGQPAEVLLTGGGDAGVRDAAILNVFGLEPVFGYRLAGLWGLNGGRTLDERQAFAEGMRKAFRARHGREPTPDDRFHGLTPA